MQLPIQRYNVDSKNTFYWGVGIGLGMLAIAGVFVYIHQKTKAQTRQQKPIDLSVFDSPDSPGSGKCMDKEFIQMLRELEQKTRLPIFRWINSGARTHYWNRKVGGVANSAHKIPKCKAADIKAPTRAIRNRIVQIAKEIGFKRIGIGKTFVHLDNDYSKPQYVAWGYPKGASPPFNPFATA